ncbi:MAG: hypothetical protein K2X86_08210 [Cytophagaceae bacterium]|nr:hypothetical protein [Cytophagaceae bacterium]
MFKKISIFIVLLIMSVALFVGCNEKEKHAKDEHAYYTCPMHPDVKKDEPGSCPICGMDLVKKE